MVITKKVPDEEKRKARQNKGKEFFFHYIALYVGKRRTQKKKRGKKEKKSEQAPKLLVQEAKRKGYIKAMSKVPQEIANISIQSRAKPYLHLEQGEELKKKEVKKKRKNRNHASIFLQWSYPAPLCHGLVFCCPRWKGEVL